MFNLVFASGHGGATKEIKLLCERAGVQLSLPGTETRKALKHLVKDEDAAKLDVPLYKTMDDIKAAIARNEIDGWLVAQPKTIEKIRENFGEAIPIAARHSVNSYKRYQELGLKNFISPSRSALKTMNVPNQWLSVKVRDFKSYRKTSPETLPAHQRKGYYSYIHHYKRYWKRAFEFYTTVQEQINDAVHIENFGAEADRGIVNDHKTMLKSKATLHIKDGQVCCNAPINSICLGIPVLMDYKTLEVLGMEDYIIHQVSGLLFETPEECVNWIRTLEYDNDFLNELSRRTRAFAELKCQYTSQDYVQFRNFLNRMKAC